MDFIQSQTFQMIIVAFSVGLAAALLGVFVILRKLSYFPDALAHAALAGVALGLLLHINIILGAAVFSLLMAASIAALERKKIIGLDTVIVIFFSAALALAVAVAEYLHVSEEDLIGYLFGDISKVNFATFVLAIAIVLLLVLVLILKFRVWTKISFHPDLAAIEGVKVNWENYLFMMLLALFVAVSIRLVGTILVGPLLVIPAATANNFGQSFKGVFIGTIVFSLASVAAGFFISGITQISIGPIIVLVAAGFFGLSLLFKK